MKKYDNKSVLITGTSRGIGKALAEHFADEGATVYAVSRTEIDYDVEGIISINCDIRNIDGLINEIKQYTEAIDILINNAGIICYKKLLRCSIDDFRDVFETNVYSTVLLSNEIAQMMIKTNTPGIIVNTLSFAAKIPSVGSAIYASSKSALESLTKTMAAEYAPYNIRVNGYSPGVIYTEMTMPAVNNNKEKMEDNIAIHRIGQVEDVINAVDFLVDPKSSYINGINLDVSGGKFIVQNAESTRW